MGTAGRIIGLIEEAPTAIQTQVATARPRHCFMLGMKMRIDFSVNLDIFLSI